MYFFLNYGNTCGKCVMPTLTNFSADEHTKKKCKFIKNEDELYYSPRRVRLWCATIYDYYFRNFDFFCCCACARASFFFITCSRSNKYFMNGRDDDRRIIDLNWTFVASFCFVNENVYMVVIWVCGGVSMINVYMDFFCICNIYAFLIDSCVRHINFNLICFNCFI